MTPKGFKAWMQTAKQGSRIHYYEGKHLQETKAVMLLRDAVMAAYEAGVVTLFQKRMTPAQGITNRTCGTFAYVAIKL